MRKLFYCGVIAAASLVIGCGGSSNANSTTANGKASVNSNANLKPEPPKNATTPLEKALFTVRVGDFEQVLLFQRKDGGVFSAADKDFLRNNSPAEQGRTVNRWAACDDGKCYFAGTNFKFSRENLIALQNRFEVKDYTNSDAPAEIVLPPAATPTVAPSNANKGNGNSQ